ncbi:membrane protein [Arthrobacter phage DrManhattan]|uniref:Membrane protein n=1 Tax=Arthrobacter phage DrManhattan TaxID=2419955 RepID=A0A3G2KFI6_9CAUD|nr:hypothetical protein HOU48_gp29 [Arthrobacter phage DrManhattan]AYN57749.1 membrane protein [Arthrobacter phage DrManhattan]
MGFIAALVWAAVVCYGPIYLDFWTEVALIFLGAFVLGALGSAAEK